MTDSLQRFLFEEAPVRYELVHLDATWRAVLERRDYPRPLQQLLGELIAAALLSATVKFEGSIVMQIQGGGPVKLVVVECTHDRTLRATAKWEGDIHPVAMLRMLGLDEVRSIIAERDAIEVSCEFCNRRYEFDAVDAEQLFASDILRDADATKH